jgi:cysteine desulfurase / selenocysteine lyase
MNVEKLREDFPVLKKGIIYMDSACVTLKPKQVVEAMNEYYYEFPACGGRSKHSMGDRVTDEVEKARKIVANFFNAKTNEIVFTKNTTEGINLVANSLGLKKGDKVVTSDKEHNSNLIPWQKLKKIGIIHEIVKSNDDNTFNLEEFREKVKGAKLVSVVHTSNADGVTNPIKEIIKIAHKEGALTLIDAAQSAAHKELNVKKLDVDFLVCSGHKMLGPSGTGILYGKYKLLEELDTFIVGGDTVMNTTYDDAKFERPPAKFEAGLQNYAGIIGLGAAIKYLQKVGLKNIAKHEYELNKKITDALKGKIEILGPIDPKERSGIISFNIPGKDPHEVGMMLDHMAHIMVRSGAHCVHSWFNAHDMHGTARIALYFYNTEEECDVVIENINKIIDL